MSKAILVLDEMPKSCIECPFYYEYEQAYFCKTLKKITGAKDECPLKPMPERKNEDQAYALFPSDNRSYVNGVVDGYNACLDDILGGSHE